MRDENSGAKRRIRMNQRRRKTHESRGRQPCPMCPEAKRDEASSGRMRHGFAVQFEPVLAPPASCRSAASRRPALARKDAFGRMLAASNPEPQRQESGIARRLRNTAAWLFLHIYIQSAFGDMPHCGSTGFSFVARPVSPFDHPIRFPEVKKDRLLRG